MNEERKSVEAKVRKQVIIELTFEQEFGLAIVKKRTGIDYDNLTRLAISEYLNRHLSADEKDNIKYSIPDDIDLDLGLVDYME